MSDHDERKDDEEHEGEDDKGGYGNPPKHSRFIPGKSGNPRGRPKGSKNLKTLLREIFREEIPITIDGRTRKVPALLVAVLKLRIKAFEGNDRSLREFVDMGWKYVGDSEDEQAEDTISPEAEAILQRFVERHDQDT